MYLQMKIYKLVYNIYTHVAQRPTGCDMTLVTGYIDTRHGVYRMQAYRYVILNTRVANIESSEVCSTNWLLLWLIY